MERHFPPVEIDDCDGSVTRIEVGTDTNWRSCVRLTCQAHETFNEARGYLDPAGARAVAAALLEAADEADERQLADDQEAAELADRIIDADEADAVMEGAHWNTAAEWIAVGNGPDAGAISLGDLTTEGYHRRLTGQGASVRFGWVAYLELAELRNATRGES